jgi:predicted GIY-YIG superfamily endonuclease
MSAIIYRLCSDTTPAFYVGSTSRDLKHRLSKHKNKSWEAPNRKLYKHILENGGFKEWRMEALETIDTDNRLTRAMREQFWIDELKPELNSIRVLG